MPLPGTPVPAQPTARSAEPVEIFRAGTYDGEDYPIPFLQKVVDNYHKYQAKKNDQYARPVAYYVTPEMAREVASNPSIGLGHENDQAILRWLMQRTDLPSAGFPINLKLDGPSLMAEFDGMPQQIASKVNGGDFHTMSAEFYPDCVDEQTGQSVGPMLRRVSLLGGDIPKVKGLRLPTMVFTERRPLGKHSFRQVKSIVCFAEREYKRDNAGKFAAGSGGDTKQKESFARQANTHKETSETVAAPHAKKAYASSAKAYGASGAHKDKGTADEHKSAAASHAEAATHHDQAANEENRKGNTEGVKAHYHMAAQHRQAVQHHEKQAKPGFFGRVKGALGFSEGDSEMDRTAMMAALQACGVSLPELESADDTTLAMMLKVAQAAKGGVATASEEPPIGSATAPAPVLTNAEMDEPDEGKRMAMMAEACSSGDMPKVKAMAEAWFAGSKGPTETFAEPVAPEMTGDKDKDSKAMATFAEKLVKHHVSRAVAPYLQSIGLVKGYVQDKQAETRQLIHTFCETLVRQGKITPFEMGTKAADGKPKPSIVDRLMSLDGDKKIITFGERRVSPRESWMLELEARPAVRQFSEKLGQDMNNTADRQSATSNQQPSLTSPSSIREALGHTVRGRQALAMHDAGKVKIDGL